MAETTKGTKAALAQTEVSSSVVTTTVSVTPAPAEPVYVEVEKPEPKVVRPKLTIVEEPAQPKTYKLNMRRADGQLRGEISKATLLTVAAQYGDLIRSIPSSRFATMDEIVSLVWEAEKRSYLKGHPRTRKQIEDGVRHMVEAAVVVER
jgi:hypothetical protein